MPNIHSNNLDFVNKYGRVARGANCYFKPIVPIIDIPYFGTQARFSDFFATVIKQYFPTLEGITYAETNSGNCDSSFLFASKYKMNVITNDLGLYSFYTAKACGGDCSLDSIKKAAYCAALIDVMGSYSPQLPETNEELKRVEDRQQYWINKFNKIKIPNIYKANYNLSLEEFLDVISPVDVIFSDYAWPWRFEGDGETKEYTASVDLFRKYLTGEELNFKALTRADIIPFVLENTAKAVKKCKYFLLSNQSSNYPDPETLEFVLMDAGYEYDRYTMFTEKQDVDDLGNQNKYLVSNLWCETVYVIKGELD